MEKKDLVDGEEIITQSDNNIVTLTTHRIRYSDTEFGEAHIVSIMLEKISSIEVHYLSNTIYLAFGMLGVIMGALGLLNKLTETAVLILLGGAVLLAMYFWSRKYLVTISSDGGAKINFQAKGMKRETINDFINKTEKATDRRRHSLSVK